jgi:hypothetical protein
LSNKTFSGTAVGDTSVLVRGIASQTGFIADFQNSSNTSLARVDINGNIVAGNPTTVTAKFQALQPTLGSEVIRLESVATNDDVVEVTYQNRAATTNNTATALHTLATASNFSYALEATVLARRTGGTAGAVGDTARYKILACYKNIAGVVTIVGVVNRTIDENVAGYDANFAINGTNIETRVTGVNNTNITWHVTLRVMALST